MILDTEKTVCKKIIHTLNLCFIDIIMAQQIHDETKKILTSQIKKHAVVDFFETGMTGLSKEFNRTIDSLISSQWPKAYMITKSISEYESQKVQISKDIVL